jgi:hypothetical protein
VLQTHNPGTFREKPTGASMNFDLSSFVERGYCLVDGFEPGVTDIIRGRYMEVFDQVAAQNGHGPVEDDSDLASLYSTKKELWIAAADQLPYLPESLSQVGHPRLLELATLAGIRMPAVSGYGVPLLINMPYDDPRLYSAHQDITFIPGSLNGITIWVPLQDTDLELGPLEVVPGSHRNGILETNGASDVKNSKLLNPYPEGAFVPIPTKRTQCIIFSKFLVHRSGRNRTPGVRFSLQYRYNDLASPEYLGRKLTFENVDQSASGMMSGTDL